MNERIKKLAEQAGVLADYGEDIKEGRWSIGGNCQSMEKFVELIVRECIQVGGPEDSYQDEWFKAKTDSVAKIKKHFGIEK